jgi:hypothetical protein
VSSFGRAFKLPGNASSVPARSSAPGTRLDPLSPPDTLTRTAQPAGPAFVGDDVEYLPTLGDPHFNAWDYLASTPPDLAWGLDTDG